MHRHITALTGAGISAESGIPTFRGSDGFWTVGSRNYRPQELATRRAFERMPREIWGWYLNRLHACSDAKPNTGHLALARLAQELGPRRFTLITQNVDGLHARSGLDEACLIEIHGNLRRMRCFAECHDSLQPLPHSLRHGTAGDLCDEDWARLRCQRCGGPMRPHVLWFDEYYEERYYRSDSALKAVKQSDLLLVIGTSGSTTLPALVVEHALFGGMDIIEFNTERSAFTPAIEASPNGRFIRASAAKALPECVEELIGAVG
ncbi:MAG: Sir2 family NAD-dependent protein deacetylase [Xanthomonadales bacterium]|nr:Sir2 family NAD-dependent protein deacetylase [Xanthomonadales bacterium]